MKEAPEKTVEFATKRVIFYGRFRTDDQTKKDTNCIETQENYVDRYIGLHKQDGWQKVRSIYDLGYSANDLNRPGLRELIKLVKSDEVDVIVVYQLDRMTRSISDLYKFCQLLEEHKVELVSATVEGSSHRLFASGGQSESESHTNSGSPQKAAEITLCDVIRQLTRSTARRKLAEHKPR
jgi:predicted site-specific integrase-resolvase